MRHGTATAQSPHETLRGVPDGASCEERFGVKIEGGTGWRLRTSERLMSLCATLGAGYPIRAKVIL